MTMLVKLGGSLLEDASLRHAALDVLATLHRDGRRLVVVHGGGKHVDALLSRLGIEKRLHDGLRITDAETLSHVVSTLAGSVNKMLVSELAARQVRAFGLSGADGGCVTAARLAASVDLGAVGKVTRCEPEIVNQLLDGGYLPLLASVAISEDGSLLNVNADSLAAAVAAALGATRLVFMTDVDGVRTGSGETIARLDARSIASLIDSGVVHGGMKPKLLAACSALGSVAEVVIAGPDHHLSALQYGNGGTRIAAS
jgi:acetylglutamate kinase